MDETIHVTGLTPDPALTPPEPTPAPAAPSAPEETPAPEVAQPSEQPAAEEAAPQEATAQTPAASPELATPGDGTPPPKKPARGVQKALDRLTERAVVAERERDTILAAVQQLLQQQRAPAAPANGQAAPAPQPQPPKPEAFTSALDYQQAVARYAARQEAEAAVNKQLGQFVNGIMQQANTQAVQAQETAINARYAEALEKAPERFTDWEDTVIASDLPVPKPLELAIKASADPAAVLHHLATNPQVHLQLAQMQPWQQMYEVGRIAGQLQTRPVPSKAPPPAKPIGGKSSPAATPTDDMTPEQWKAYARKAGLTRGLR